MASALVSAAIGREPRAASDLPLVMEAWSKHSCPPILTTPDSRRVLSEWGGSCEVDVALFRASYFFVL